MKLVMDVKEMIVTHQDAQGISVEHLDVLGIIVKEVIV
jgi:hypothetical protein